MAVTKRTVSIRGRPVLDLVSYARRGPGRADQLSPAEVQQIERTVGRTPEVMIKVLSQGGQDLRAVRRHFEYLSRRGELDIETDDGTLQGKGAEKELLEDWDLDLDAHRRRNELTAVNRRKPPKLVHKLMFSMPPGTPPDKLLAAVRDFVREEFAFKHRYAMVLHTDDPHPHVHMVVKAVSEQGERLNIRKATLREWREEFARHLRAHGVAANATQRYMRGETKPRKPDGIYRALLRGNSTHMYERMQGVAQELRNGDRKSEPGKVRLLETRSLVEKGWRVVRDILASNGHQDLATSLDGFVRRMPPPLTEKEWLAEQLQRHRRLERVQMPAIIKA